MKFAVESKECEVVKIRGRERGDNAMKSERPLEEFEVGVDKRRDREMKGGRDHC